MNRKAFTLVELLVVVAIISILASMLLPALQEAIDLARTTTCASNMRQQYLGISMYVGDSDDRLPFLENWQQVHRLYWMFAITPYIGHTGFETGNSGHSGQVKLSSSVVDRMVWRQGPWVCPSMGRVRTGTYWQGGVGDPYYWINYGSPGGTRFFPYRHNTAIWSNPPGTWNTVATPQYRWGEAKNGYYPVFVEAFLDNINVSGAMGVYYSPHHRIHGEMTNALLGNGAVKADYVINGNGNVQPQAQWFRTHQRD